MCKDVGEQIIPASKSSLIGIRISFFFKLTLSKKISFLLFSQSLTLFSYFLMLFSKSIEVVNNCDDLDLFLNKSSSKLLFR